MSKIPCTDPTVAEIDLQALDHNYRVLRTLVASSVRFLAVVKADAYGHGAVAVSRRLEGLGVDFFGVTTVQEGVALRTAGITRPILVLSGVCADALDPVFAYRLTPMLFRLEIAEPLSREARRRGETLPVHLKVDTGMGRIGILPDQVPSAIRELGKHENLTIEGIASHFSTADEEDPSFTHEQLNRFSSVVDQVELLGIRPSFCHVANSAALFTRPTAHLNMVRPGIMLYGANPTPGFTERDILRPVMSWKTRVRDVRDVPSGFPISYGRTHTTSRPSRIAALPVGYADGYSRSLSNRGQVLVQGQRAPVVGRVCMDWTMIDVTDIDDVGIGDEVVLLGNQGGDMIAAEELAERAGSISYEILCSVGKRVPRVYRG
jgi:alanine racemase